MKFSQAKIALGAVALATMLAFGTTATAAPISKCNASKKKCIGKYIASVMGCHAKAESKSLMVDPTCLSKATAKITGAGKGCFDKADAKDDNCSQTGDANAQLAVANAFINDVVDDIDPNYPTPHTNKCDAAQKKCVGKKASALMGCKAKENKSGSADPACDAKAMNGFSNVDNKGCFDKAVIKDDGPCDGASAAAIEIKVDDWVDDAADAVDGPAVPTPTATSTPVGPTCGNSLNDPGEPCDASAPSAGWAQCGPDFTCTACNCACPNTVAFSGNATDPVSILDTGFSGISHRSPIVSNGDVTIDLNCGASSRPCGVCPVTGPVVNANAGAGKLDNQRCSNDPSLKCAADATCTAGVNKCSGGVNDGGACTVTACGAPGTCNAGTCVGGPNNGAGCCNGGFCRSGVPAPTCGFYFGTPLALAAGGVSTCVVNNFKQPITGTANVETGDASTTSFLTAKVYSGIAVDNPCPRCSDVGPFNDTVTTGTCDDGPHIGKSCDANGEIPSRPDFGRTSLDCPPNPAGIIATLTIDLSSKTGTVIKTLSAASPNCSDAPGNKCLCDTCNNVNAELCDDNSDCPNGPPASIGAICGGKRCLGGPNLGVACNNNSECPGVAQGCGRPGEPTKPSACSDNTSIHGFPNNHFDCSDQDLDGVGECEDGPNDGNCSLASGHAQRGCTGGSEVVDCGGPGTCISAPRKCFLTGGGAASNNPGSDTLIAVGMADTPMGDVSNPTLGAVFCVAPTTASAINKVAGLPGPSRITIKGTAVGHP